MCLGRLRRTTVVACLSSGLAMLFLVFLVWFRGFETYSRGSRIFFLVVSVVRAHWSSG
jgi:hypothetical protein